MSTEAAMIRVLVADDHPLLRSGLKQVLSQEADLAVIGEAEDSDQVLRQVNETTCDVVVLDLTMPGRGGLDVLREIRRQHPNLPILILSMHAEDQFAVRAIKAGASGYLSDPQSADRQEIRQPEPGGDAGQCSGSGYRTSSSRNAVGPGISSPVQDRVRHDGFADRGGDIVERQNRQHVSLACS